MNKQIIDEDTANEKVLDDLEGDFDTFLHNRDFKNAEIIIDNLRDMGKYEKAIELLKRLTARKMTVPADYGFHEETHFRAEDNPLNGVKVEGVDEDVIF